MKNNLPSFGNGEDGDKKLHPTSSSSLILTFGGRPTTPRNNAVATTAKNKIRKNNAKSTYLILTNDEMTLFNNFLTLASCSTC